MSQPTLDQPRVTVMEVVLAVAISALILMMTWLWGYKVGQNKDTEYKCFATSSNVRCVPK